MGMDVYGRKPKDEEGNYFRANVWSWRPIQTLMQIANTEAKVFDLKTMNAMAHNDGAGLKCQSKCDKLAKCLEEILKDKALLRSAGLVVTTSPDGNHTAYSFKATRDCAVDKDGRFVTHDEKIILDDLQSPYVVHEEHVWEFIKFLRKCGGFKVC
jgi:hypothetical protein